MLSILDGVPAQNLNELQENLNGTEKKLADKSEHWDFFFLFQSMVNVMGETLHPTVRHLASGYFKTRVWRVGHIPSVRFS